MFVTSIITTIIIIIICVNECKVRGDKIHKM